MSKIPEVYRLLPEIGNCVDQKLRKMQRHQTDFTLSFCSEKGAKRNVNDYEIICKGVALWEKGSMLEKSKKTEKNDKQLNLEKNRHYLEAYQRYARLDTSHETANTRVSKIHIQKGRETGTQ